MPGAVINADARVGRNSIVNTGAIVEHDCLIGDHAHIAPRVALGGAVKVGDFALIGSGAVALPGAAIGENAIVGARKSSRRRCSYHWAAGGAASGRPPIGIVALTYSASPRLPPPASC